MAELNGDSIANSAGTGAPNFPFGLLNGGLPIGGAYYGINPDVGGATPFNLTAASNRRQIIQPAAAIVIVLPTTSIVKGDVWYFQNPNNSTIVVQASNASQISQFQQGYITVVAKINNPVASTDWQIVDLFSDWANDSGNWVLQGVNTSTPSVYVQRVYKSINVRGIFDALGTPNGSIVQLLLPAAFPLDPNRISPSSTGPIFGDFSLFVNDATSRSLWQAGFSGKVYWDGGDPDLFMSYNSKNNQFEKILGSAAFTTGGALSFTINNLPVLV